MKPSFLPIFVVIIAQFFSTYVLAADVSDKKINELSLGMNKKQVTKILGQPVSIRPQGIDEDGKNVERLEYSVFKRIDMSKVKVDTGQREMTYTCYLMLVDGVLKRIERKL